MPQNKDLQMYLFRASFDHETSVEAEEAKRSGQRHVMPYFLTVLKHRNVDSVKPEKGIVMMGGPAPAPQRYFVKHCSATTFKTTIT